MWDGGEASVKTDEQAIILRWIETLTDEECRQILIMPCEIRGTGHPEGPYIAMDFDDLRWQLTKAVKGMIL